MSGYYPKVLQPNKIFPQMESLNRQPRFYQGGSEVPISLGFNNKTFHEPKIKGKRKPKK